MMSGCAWCKKTALLVCSNCKMVKYCCRDHQIEDYNDHKNLCKELKKATAKKDKEEHKLHEHPEGDHFVDWYVGRFWGLHDTRPYMRARMEVIRLLELIGTKLSLSAAVVHIRDCLRLCRGDNLGLRYLAPALMLRIGQDQESYDFIKWWVTFPDSHYDWGDMDLPYLHITGADMLEAPFDEFFDRKYGPELTFYAAIVLIKIRLLLAVLDVSAFDCYLLGTRCSKSLVRCFAGNYRVLSTIRSYLFVDSKNLTMRAITSRGGAKKLAEDLSEQVRSLLVAGDKRNFRLWKAILDPVPILQLPDAQYHSHDSVEEVQVYLSNIVPSWTQTPAALDLLRRHVNRT